MKREQKLVEKYAHGVFLVYPLLIWRKCCKCEKEFVRQKGWRALVPPFINGFGRWAYVCRECAPTRKHAHELFCNGTYLPPRLELPSRLSLYK